MASKDDFRCPISSFDPEIDDYLIWRKEAQLWDQVTDAPKKKRGSTIFWKLKGRAKTAINNIENKDLSSATGFEKVIEKLDASFLPDEFEREFWPLHDLFSFKKTPEMSMKNYLLDYDQKFTKFSKTSGHISNTVAAYKLLSGADLTVAQIQSVKAGLGSSITYENMKAWLKKLFVVKKCDLSGKSGETSSNELEQPTLYSDQATEYNKSDDVFLSARGRNRFSNSGFRGRSRGLPNFRPKGSSSYRSRGNSRREEYRNRNNRQEEYRRTKQNPRDRVSGDIMSCNFCKSTLHFMGSCPDFTDFLNESKGRSKAKVDADYVWFMVYMTGQPGNKLQGLVEECKGFSILDSGCPNTVCGEAWMESYIQTLSADDQEKITFEASTESFTFGDGNGIKSNRKMTIPIWATGKRGYLQTDVVSSNIPLLLSVKVMEKAGMVLDFVKAEVRMKGVTIKLKKTTSGHYAMPLSL